MDKHTLITDDEHGYLQELANRGNEEQANIEQQLLIKQRLDMKSILNSEAGKAIIWSIMSRCDIFGLSMTGNSQTYFKEGRRSVGLELLAEVIAADPKVWIEIQQENLKDIHKSLTESEQ